MSGAIGWFGYSVLVAALLTLGAVALEAGARHMGRAGRWAWVLSLAGTLLVPLLAQLRPAPAADTLLTLPVVTLPAVSAGGASTSGFDATSLLLFAWALLSAVVLLVLVLSYAALRRAARAWRSERCDGEEVWVSADVGPALLGVLRQRVVLPEWALGLPAEERALLLLHEREHRRAGDARLLAGAYLAAVALPWNPLVWFQIARLRHAIELDCDARVLARDGRTRAYGALLLEVGRRRSRQPLLAAAFGERSTRLEQRIRALVDHARARRPLRAAFLGAFGLALLGTSYCVRDPLAGNALPAVTAADPSTDRADAPRPASIVYTDAPELLNVREVQRALSESYPPLLRSAGIGGRATVWAFVATDGRVTKSQLSRASGHSALDEAALDVLSAMRFTPARLEGKPVAVWIELPVVFSASGDPAAGRPVVVPSADQPGQEVAPKRRAAEPGDAVPAADAASLPRRVTESPTFTPMTKRPELVNSADVVRALAAQYPPALRDAGIGGMSTVWFLIDETGAVQRTQISRSTGRPELDAAALEVAAGMRFTPAENRGTKVPVWVEIPIVFQAK
ncbi:MAG TPA: M56 family metallopeptidase [Longimicrobiales bacterium]|nr:M56 family metallopeptidase [Longimicrobiales bacterium]